MIMKRSFYNLLFCSTLLTAALAACRDKECNCKEEDEQTYPNAEVSEPREDDEFIRNAGQGSRSGLDEVSTRSGGTAKPKETQSSGESAAGAVRTGGEAASKVASGERKTGAAGKSKADDPGCVFVGDSTNPNDRGSGRYGVTGNTGGNSGGRTSHGGNYGTSGTPASKTQDTVCRPPKK